MSAAVRNTFSSSKQIEELNDTEITDKEEEEDVEQQLALDLGPQLSLKEQIEKDKDDESLRRWKEQLLGSVDMSAVGESKEAQVKILSIRMESPGREDLILPVTMENQNGKKCVLGLKEGTKYRLKLSFIVSNNIVSGLYYSNTVWKSGVRVDHTKVMLGTFSPKHEPYTYEFEEETTPSGIFVRGSYSARTKIVDDDGKCHLDVSYQFQIQKKWPSRA